MTSNAELLLSVQLEQAHILFEREVGLWPGRKFRADFWLPDHRHGDVVLEIEGGTWVGGRHSRGIGFERDCEKQALAVLQGIRYFRCTANQVENGTALSWIRQALGLEVAA